MRVASRASSSCTRACRVTNSNRRVLVVGLVDGTPAVSWLTHHTYQFVFFDRWYSSVCLRGSLGTSKTVCLAVVGLLLFLRALALLAASENHSGE